MYLLGLGTVGCYLIGIGTAGYYLIGIGTAGCYMIGLGTAVCYLIGLGTAGCYLIGLGTAGSIVDILADLCLHAHPGYLQAQARQPHHGLHHNIQDRLQAEGLPPRSREGIIMWRGRPILLFEDGRPILAKF